MAREFIHENFLLDTKTAQTLFHNYAKSMPIIDYHNHLSPRDVAHNRQFENMAQIWLAEDHYKWRALRACGVDEKFITGDASDWEKFLMWAKSIPKMIRNPLYHWTHLELKRPFGISNLLLNEKNAKTIWNKCNAKLATKDFTAQAILKKMNVKVICTTDDPIDSLEHHIEYQRQNNLFTKMLPTFRTDRLILIDNIDAYLTYLSKLEHVSGVEIKDYNSLLLAIKMRHNYFHEHGCRISDSGSIKVYADDYTESEIKSIFKKIRKGKKISQQDSDKFKSALTHEVGIMNFEKGWAQQIHIGPMRNNNTRMFKKLGVDRGYDSMSDYEMAKPLAKLLDNWEVKEKLAKTIVYNLNPKDTTTMATTIGNFQDGSMPGKLQYGAAWWFQDQLDGMRDQINAASNYGVLSTFVGMLTDSRSLLSFTRHEYFRRLLCNILGSEMEKGLIPNDTKFVGSIVQDICYNNAKNYFKF